MENEKKGGVFFIINPVSGHGSGTKAIRQIRKLCEKKGLRYAFHETYQVGDGSALSRKGVACGFDTIVAVGGDGTVNEVGRELVGTDVKLGIIPKGSGNGLARHLGIPMSTSASLRRVIQGRKVIIDTGELDGHIFLNMAGIGFDAHVSKAFSESTRRGWFNYLKIILRLGRNIEKFHFMVKTEDGNKEYDSIMLSVANSAQYGNNAKIAPKADIADGMADVCVLRPISFFGSIIFLLKVMTGTVRKNKKFDIFKAQSFTIEGTDGLAHIDGDPIEINKTVKVEMKPKSLNVIC